MADVLMVRPSAYTPDPDDPTGYLPGMVVDIYEDGTIPDCLGSPRCFVVRIPGVPVVDVEEFLEVVTDEDFNITKRRAKKFDFTGIPQGILDVIESTREYTVTENQFRNAMKQIT